MKTLLKTALVTSTLFSTIAFAQLSGSRNAIKYDFKNRVYAPTCITTLKLENNSSLNEKVETSALADLITSKLKEENNLIVSNSDKNDFELSIQISQEVVDNGDKVRTICHVNDLALKVAKTEILLNKASAAKQVKVKKESSELDSLIKACDQAISKAISKMISCTIKR